MINIIYTHCLFFFSFLFPLRNGRTFLKLSRRAMSFWFKYLILSWLFSYTTAFNVRNIFWNGVLCRRHCLSSLCCRKMDRCFKYYFRKFFWHLQLKQLDTIHFVRFRNSVNLFLRPNANKRNKKNTNKLQKLVI